MTKIIERIKCLLTAHSYQPPFAGTWDDQHCRWCGKANPRPPELWWLRIND